MRYDLDKARKIAEELAEKYKKKGAIGIVFLGALVRGYFDSHADIDIIVFTRKPTKRKGREPIGKYKGFDIDLWLTTIEHMNKTFDWPMPGRWAWSQADIYYDPTGKIKKIKREKARFNKGERKWLMIEGIVQSEWFCNFLPDLWVTRKDIVSAHAMFDKGLQHFFEALFAFNKQLVPYEKWRLNYSRKLKWLPRRYDEKINEVHIVRTLNKKELQRRKKAFMYLWKQLFQKIEKEVGMSIKEMDRLV